MKQKKQFSSSWLLRKLNESDFADGILKPEAYTAIQPGQNWYHCACPASVHEILFANQKISPDVLLGDCESALWVAESDWLYCTEWIEESDSSLFLTCEQVDTYADFYLNGVLIASHDDSFLPFCTELFPDRKKTNLLAVHFHSPYRMKDKLWASAPDEWKGHIDPSHLLRKPPSVFGGFLGARPYLTTIGFAGDILLESREKASFSELDLSSSVSAQLDHATLSCSALTSSDNWTHINVTLLDPQGNAADSQCLKQSNSLSCSLTVSSPQLWWPAGYGAQPLYSVCAELWDNNTLLDREFRKIGFRRIDRTGDFAFRINNRPIRLWGANIVNNTPLTQRWNAEKGAEILSLAKNGNMNILRVWGEAPMIEDSFYDFCDENGILIWQDFPIGYGMWPDSEDYLIRYRKEAEAMVKRLRHRPSILLWCGSNESYMYSMSASGQNKTFGHRILFEAVQEVCMRLDPGRYYHFSSPSGGDYPQSPLGGDIHGYNRIQFEPGSSYPVLFSEYCHMTPMAKHSTLRFMTPEEIFPEGYCNYLPYRSDFKAMEQVGGDILANNFWRDIPIPESWKKHLSVFGPADLDQIQNYYDASDADSLLYRYAACACDSYKEAIENIRRGRPSCRAGNPDRCQGMLVWKLNDCFPHFNFTLIDAFLEPTPTYYAVKRGFSPLLVSIHRENDHLYLWGCNDSPNDISATIVLRVFSRIRNRIEKEFDFPVKLRAGTSELVSCLDFIGPVQLDCLLHAQMIGENQNILSSNLIPLDFERNLPFPDASLSLEQDKNELIIRTNYYARYIELSGDDNGNAFGWQFEDNYFDLLPFETKRIKLLGKHRSGTVRAKAQYSSQTAEIRLR